MNTDGFIPKLTVGEKNFDKKSDFLIISSTNSSSDYRNDRERPYNGQPHRDDGIRGQTEVKGLTMRDIKDCFVQGCLEASLNEDLRRKTVERNEEFKNTEYSNTNTWRERDVYEIDFSKVDPIAIFQNMSCHIERMMGIYPNVPKIK